MKTVAWSGAPAPAAAGPSAPRLPLLLFLAYVFLTLSRATEFLLPIPKLMAVVGILTFASAALTTGFRGVQSGLSLLFLAFFGCMILSCPFAFWRAGAFGVVYSWLPLLLLFVSGAMLVTDVRAAYRLMYTVAASTVFVLAMAIVYGASEEGDRLNLTGSSTIGNANDLATTILFGLPCFLLLLVSTRGILVKVFASACVICAFIVTLRTASRAGLLAIVVMALTSLWGLPAAKKFVAVVAVLLLALLSYPFLPAGVTARFRTLSYVIGSEQHASNREELSVQGGANLSTEKRITLVKKSISMTLRHPLFGVGMGQFAAAAHAEFMAEGKNIYEPAHNSYTEVSSNLGVFGFLAYIGILAFCFRVVGKVRRRAKWNPAFRDVFNLAYAVRLMLIGYCVTSAFTSIPYKFYVPTLGALVCSLLAWLKRQGADSAPFTPSPYTRTWNPSDYQMR